MSRVSIPLVVLGMGIIPVSAHSMDQVAVLLDFRDNVVEAEIQLPAERLEPVLGNQEPASTYILNGVSAMLPDGRPFAAKQITAPSLSRIDGAPFVVARVRFVPPEGSTPNVLDLRCDLLFERIPTQEVLVSIRTDWRTSTFANEPQLVGVLHGSDRTVHLDRRKGSWWSGFGSIFRLGMRHIAEGTDHLLFLLVLLLPAPVLVLCGRWMGYADIRPCLLSVGKIVTAFTLGHSLTLAAGTLDLVHVPSRPVEVLIAVSMQLLVVAAALPSLILLSRTRLYSAFRISGAVFAGAAAAAWIAQRLWDLPNPADALVTVLAQHAGWIAAGLTVLGVLTRMSELRAEARMTTDSEL
jgi:HupE / UreJ protein